MQPLRSTSSPSNGTQNNLRYFAWALACLVVVLGAFFLRSFEAGQVLFSNDSPLGLLCSEAVALPSALKGYWQDLNWIGGTSPSASPSYSTAVWLLINSPVVFAKFYAPISLLTAGLCGWLLFRQLGFSQWASVLGALAASLNMNTFSNACWGLPTRALALAASFLALAALSSRSYGRPWLKTILGGLAVGLGIMEGFDIGAIFSLYVAAFTLFAAWVGQGPPLQRVVRGAISVAVVAGFAAIISACTLSTLIGTQIKGIVGTQQDNTTREQRWDEATMWSLPKIETLRVIIPGLFGYRMDAPDGGNYWGAVGQQPGWEQNHIGLARHSGSGEYAGVIVVLIAVWGFFRSLQKQQNSFSEVERKMIWFWAGAAIVSLFLAFGRHAPFYRIVYSLPYFSTIRNPIKFMHPFQMTVLILFGYGLEGLYRSYLAKNLPAGNSLFTHLKTWWTRASATDRKWVIGSVVALAASLIGVLCYGSSLKELEQYLQKVGFPGELSSSIAKFSLKECASFVAFLAAGVAFLIVVLSGFLSGRRASFAGVILGLLIVADLAHGDSHWISYYDYRAMYSSNPVIELLKDKPYEHRVAARLGPLHPQYLVAGQEGRLLTSIAEDWLQHKYQFYNIQSLDIVQMPRMPEMDATYLAAINTPTFSAAELKDIHSFASKLTNHVDSVSLFIWEQLSSNAKAQLQHSGTPSADSSLVADELNRIIEMGPIYNANRFAAVQLSPEARSLLGQNLQGRELIRLNRLLLEEAYPNELAKRSLIMSFAKLWQLTNTKYILGMTGYLDSLNNEMDPVNRSFRLQAAFEFAPRQSGMPAGAEDITTVLQPNGKFAVFEFGAALPRTQLFEHWQVSTNDKAALQRLADPYFDPRKEVLVADSAPPAPLNVATNPAQSVATITHYKPKHVVITAQPVAPAILLLNDKYDPDWKVTVDGRSAPLLRCNYIMRGVYLEPGNHEIVFNYDPPHWTLYISLAGVAVGIVICGLAAFGPKGGSKKTEPHASH